MLINFGSFQVILDREKFIKGWINVIGPHKDILEFNNKNLEQVVIDLPELIMSLYKQWVIYLNPTSKEIIRINKTLKTFGYKV